MINKPMSNEQNKSVEDFDTKIKKLLFLRQQNIISEEEFNELKMKLINSIK